MRWEKEAEKFGADRQRVEVWKALSEFYLDTEPQANDLERIAQTLARSPYSIEELRHIERFEVEPVCHWNLTLVAGEWAGFDPDWLIPRCLHRQRNKPYVPGKKWTLVERFFRACPSNLPNERIAEIRAAL